MGEATRSRASYSAQQLRAYAATMRDSPARTPGVMRLCDHIDAVCDELLRTEATMRAGRKMRDAIRVLINTLGDDDDG